MDWGQSSTCHALAKMKFFSAHVFVVAVVVVTGVAAHGAADDQPTSSVAKSLNCDCKCADFVWFNHGNTIGNCLR